MAFSQNEIENIIRTKETLKALLTDDQYWLINHIYNKSIMSNCFVAGGIFASLLRQDKQFNDIDVYFRDYNSREAMLNVFSHISTKSFSAVSTEKEKTSSSTKYAISFTNSRVSYIVKGDGFCGSPETIKKNFDFVHCLAHYCLKTDKLSISKDTYDACMNKWLILNPASGFTKETVNKYRLDKFLNSDYIWRNNA